MNKKKWLLGVAGLAIIALLCTVFIPGPKGEKGLTGDPGISGTNGSDGTNGKDGSSVLTGKGEPLSILGSNGDSYIDTDTFDFYSKKDNKWSKVGNIKGSTGDQGEVGNKGETGKEGASLLSGNGVPTSEVGNDDDSYIDLDTFDFYKKVEGEWIKYRNIKGSDGIEGEVGEKGKTGTSVLTGKDEPISTLGNDGDSYIDIKTFDFYKKESGKWVKVGSIKGERGEQGNKGDKGNTGWSGSKGDKGNPGEASYSNQIIPTKGGYVVPSVGSALEGELISFTIYTLSEDYSCTLLELISNENILRFESTEFHIDIKGNYYVDNIKMVKGGYVVKATFIEKSKYGVSIIDSGGASISHDANNGVLPGKIVNFTITPKEMTKLTSFIVNDNEVNIKDNNDGSYSYSTQMVEGGLKVKAICENGSVVKITQLSKSDGLIEVDKDNGFIGDTIEIKVKTINKKYKIGNLIINNDTIQVDTEEYIYEYKIIESKDINISATLIPVDTEIVKDNYDKLFDFTGEGDGYKVSLKKDITFDKPTKLYYPSYYNDKPVHKITKSGLNGNLRNVCSIVIPDTVKTISEYAFQNFYDLTSVYIPSSVGKIERYAFYYCGSLKSIAIPNSVTNLGAGAFDDTGLKSINLPNNDKFMNIANYTFKSSGLESITIPNSVTKIGQSAFQYCSNLKSIVIPEHVTSIGQEAFAGCSKLSSITIVNDNVDIGIKAFNNSAVINYKGKSYKYYNNRDSIPTDYSYWYVTDKGEVIFVDIP